jgi:hypothetical protein
MDTIVTADVVFRVYPVIGPDARHARFWGDSVLCGRSICAGVRAGLVVAALG